jgi:sugar phosphate isomerase/epimerase
MRKIPVGLQLFSVRGACKKNLPATLKAVREIGYEAVEPWGYDGGKVRWQDYSAKELRKMLDDSGLACCGMHIQPVALQGDNLSRCVELNQALGNQFLIIASDKDRTASEAGVRELAVMLTEAAGKLSPLGMFTGYHAHSFDFTRFGEVTAWDLLFSLTPAEVIMQLDIGNCANGGGDPVAILRKFPGRARSVHLKDYGGPSGAVLGEGKADWKEILRLCRETQNTQWYVIEEGDSEGMGFDVPKRSLTSLRRMEQS